jgi:glycosyltransferase involved in cell wall biosynthesis
MKKNTFKIAIPVLNEERGLKRGILTLNEFCMKKYPDLDQWEIDIADNGSTDKTQEIAEVLAAEYKNIKYIRLTKKGVGLALKTSWGKSNADVIGSMDLDLATDLKHLPEALSAIFDEDYDLVYGTRRHKDSKVIGRSLKREIVSRTFNFILQTYMGVSVSDSMCGFTFFKRPYLERLIENGAESDRWFFQAELLIVSEWLGLNMYALPVHWTDDQNSKVKILSLMLEYLEAMKNLKKKRSSIIK